MLYYIKLIGILAVQALFTQSLSQIQQILFGIVIAMVITIPSQIVFATLRSRLCILKFMGVTLSLGLVLVFYYVIITTAALMGVDESNQWTVSYLSVYCMDQFMVIPTKLAMKLFMMKMCILSRSGILKLVEKISKDEFNYLVKK